MLDLADIQGGILRDYGEHYPKGRYVFIQFREPADGEGLEARRGRLTGRPAPSSRTCGPR